MDFLHTYKWTSKTRVKNGELVLVCRCGSSLTYRKIGSATARSCEKLAEIAVLTDESVCPTLVRTGLRFCGGKRKRQAISPANRFFHMF